MDETKRLQAFLYLLLRDAVPFGAMEKALRDVNEAGGAVGDWGLEKFEFSEPTQAAYAEALARSILQG